MSKIVYNNARFMLFNKSLGIASDDIRCLLLGGGNVPDSAKNPALVSVSDLLGVFGVNEVVATNYSRKQTTRSILKDDIHNNVKGILSVGINWVSLGGAINDVVRSVIFYLEGSSDSNRYLISLQDLVLSIPTNGSDFVIPSGTIIIGS